MKNHALTHPVLDTHVPNPLRRRGVAPAQRSMLGLRGTVHGAHGQTLPVWVMWTAGDCAELALEARIDGALEGKGWKLEIPGLGLFAITLNSSRGVTCRVAMTSLSVDSAALAQASVRH